MAFKHVVDMRRTTEEKVDAAMPTMPAQIDDYPYGLCICLTEAELEKLDLDDDCEAGDMIHLVAFGRVTSVSKHDRDGKKTCRVEICLERLGVEDEDRESAEEEEAEEAAE